jgi:hypothetical protein
VLDDRELASELAAAGREHAATSFALHRLVIQLDRLYLSLLLGDSGARG